MPTVAQSLAAQIPLSDVAVTLCSTTAHPFHGACFQGGRLLISTTEILLVQREVRASWLWKLLAKQGTAYTARFHPQ